MSRPLSGRVQAWAAACAAVVMVGGGAGCSGDSPVDPAQEPVEVEITGCALNRDTLEPGSHSVAVLPGNNEESGRLVVTDESGTEVFWAQTGGGGQFVSEEQMYTFTCTVDDRVTTSVIFSRIRIDQNGREIRPQGR